MSITNADIAAVFDEIADWLELEQANPFRIRAYRNGARTVGSWPESLAGRLQASHTLPPMPGIGKDLTAKIEEIAHSGTCALLKRLRGAHPRGLSELLQLPGVGPRRVALLHEKLGITTARQLAQAARAGRIRALPGFGPRTEKTLLEAVSTRLGEARRWKLAVAGQYADAIVEYLHKHAAVDKVTVAGSFRRMRETVGDLDVLVTSPRGSEVSAHFVAYPEVRRILAQGPTRASIVLGCGLQIDLRVVPRASFGAALVYFTGSKAHNVALRRIAQQAGLKISEYGVFRGNRRIAGDTERSVYAAIKLPPIAPELREDRGEIDAARAGKLPTLIELSDLRGDLHAHTLASDGHATIEQMAAAACAASLDYLAITDHTQSLRVAHGLDAEQLARQIDEIDRINADGDGFVILKGAEVDILEDGSLDLPDSILARLDLVVGAVHSGFNLSRTRQTERILRAMDTPYFSILAHPTGRLIEERDAYAVDVERLIRHAIERGCYLELDAHPDRLDLNDVHCRMARDAGLMLAIASDAHDVNGFAALRYGVGQARRGWLRKSDVLNTLPIDKLRRKLNATRAAGARGR